MEPGEGFACCHCVISDPLSCPMSHHAQPTSLSFPLSLPGSHPEYSLTLSHTVLRLLQFHTFPRLFHTQPHVGFPEIRYHDMAEGLARAGYRVVVVEQVRLRCGRSAALLCLSWQNAFFLLCYWGRSVVLRCFSWQHGFAAATRVCLACSRMCGTQARVK